MRPFLTVCLLVVVALCFACGASSVNSALDKARFNLDNCSPTNPSACDSAISGADTVLASEPNNVNAAMIKSSAQATNAGFILLDMLSDLANTSGDNQTEKFNFIRSAIGDTVSDTADLRASIVTLSGITPPTATDDFYKDFYFQMGFLQALEAFALPTLVAQPTETSVVTPASISSTDKDNVQDDFINADNNLIIGGIADSSSNGWDLVVAVRQNYCVLHNLAPAGTQGFTLGLLQDLILCQLCVDDDVVTRGVCTKQAADFTAADFVSGLVATCADFNFTACANPGPTEL